jgi:xanthine dehydrogenase YagS FAD-binding subunit
VQKTQPGSGCGAILGLNRLHAVFGGSDYCVATHASDLAVALTALDATIEVQGGNGTRAVPIDEFYLLPANTPDRETVLAPGEIITAVQVPPPRNGERSHYLKLRDRASFEFAGGVGTKPWRLPAVEAALTGTVVSPEALTGAASHAAEGARPLAENGFKIPLMQRALARALLTVTA